MSGRHPDGKGKLVPHALCDTAIAGTPDEKGDFTVKWLLLTSV